MYVWLEVINSSVLTMKYCLSSLNPWPKCDFSEVLVSWRTQLIGLSSLVACSSFNGFLQLFSHDLCKLEWILWPYANMQSLTVVQNCQNQIFLYMFFSLYFDVKKERSSISWLIQWNLDWYTYSHSFFFLAIYLTASLGLPVLTLLIWIFSWTTFFFLSLKPLI